MSYHRLPSLPHVARSIRPTIEGTVKQLRRLDSGTPPFSYDLSWRLAFPLYSGALSLEAALEACRRIKVPLGARCNAEVVDILWQDSRRASYFCHPLKDRFYSIRRDLIIPVRPRFYFVKNHTVHLFWLQPWKVFDLTEQQLGILASVIKNTFAVDDFIGAHLYLLDTSADDERGKRYPQVFGFDQLPVLEEEELKVIFDRFAAAYDIFKAERKPKPERKRPDGDEDLPGLFE